MATTPTRRTFLKGTGIAGGALLVGRYTPQLGWLSPTNDPPAEGEAPAAVEERWIPTTCWIGKQDCGMLARVIDGRLVKLEGNPAHPRNNGTLCPKGMAQIQAIYDPNRVKAPLIRTNGKGGRGEWRETSWDEALTLVAEKMNEVRAKDPKLVLWQKGRSKAGAFYDKAFVSAAGVEKLHHGAFCSDAGYRSAEYTTGLHGVWHPDFRETKFLLSIGWNLTNGGGNKFCQITWHQQMLDAKERGLKIVHVDPSRRGAGPFADEWLPIRPSTDVAFLLAIAHELISNGDIDTEYLTNHTNAPFLVKPDGLFLTKDGKEQIYDRGSRSMVDFDTPGAEPALEGTFSDIATWSGDKVMPAFEALKQHVADATPEWASRICKLSPESIRKVAREMGEAAQIGSTITVDGIELPYRPVAIMGYHVTQQELGFQLGRAALIVEMLLGAIEAVGGQRTDFTYKVHKNFAAFEHLEEHVKDGPYNVWLKDSKFFPINSNNSSVVAHVMNDPERFELAQMPEMMLIHMANPVLSFADQPAILSALEKIKFVAVIDPWLSETADLFADVVLPAATIEKYEGPMSATDQYVDAVALRIPPMEPLFDSRGDIDIYLDLCEKAGILYGEGGYIDLINGELKLTDEFKLDLDTKPEVRDIFDRWAKSDGTEEGVAFFEEHGVKVKGPVPASKYYGYAHDPPFDGIRHRLYGASLKATQDAMRAKGVDEVFWRLYTALPTWMPPTMEGSPDIYDLYLTSRKMIEFKQSRSTFIPILNELAPEQFLEINPLAAKARGIEDGDMVTVQSHHALTDETRTVTVRARLLETIRPDTVVMPHHYGFFVNPITKDQGPTANVLFFSGPGYVSNTADQSFQVKVKVTKA
ncbi:MAG: molybdopterin-dependent oxidoreductase [Dehalococcoidia bacterium]